MPKISKKTKVPNESNEKIMQRFIEKRTVKSTDFNPCRLTKTIFTAIVLYGSAAVLILILFFTVNFFTSVLIKERGEIKNFSAPIDNFIYKPAGSVIYSADKSKYKLSENIKLSITNESDKSIFLVPCQYFNKFEKKELNSWKEVAINNCEDSSASNFDVFEKIQLKENQSIPSSVLGTGLWRGVSDVYIDCQKAEVSACKSKKVIYSNEFIIEAPENSAPYVLENSPNAL